MARYGLRKRWSSTNGRWGWVIWDTQRDMAASGWHELIHHHQIAADTMNHRDQQERQHRAATAI